MTAPSAPTLEQRLACWPKLQQQRARYDNITLAALFAADKQRVSDCCIEAAGLRLDYSKHFIDTQTRDVLLQLAEQAALPAAINALLHGDKVNNTEKRAALHTALRSTNSPLHGQEIADVLTRMEGVVAAIHNGSWRGFSGEKISDIVNIGIGGSDLGPQMATHALNDFNTQNVRLHFVSNVDPSCLQEILAHLNPARTLFIVASKSFTTLETLLNAEAAKHWILAATNSEQAQTAISKHFVAISTAVQKAQAFGIDAANILPIWDWVGGRYSLWSAIGLPIALAVGMRNFRQMLAGAAAMDEHFATAPLVQNMPVIMGLLGVWYRHFWGAHSHAVLPYDHYLRYFPDYLQQLDMESNGKSVSREGLTLPYSSGPIIWGSVGTNGQHSFHQLLHQGTHFIPADFILTLHGRTKNTERHCHLLANGLAQSQALMCGKTLEQAENELRQQGVSETEITSLAPHKTIPGNRPSSIISLDALTPFTLGALAALYEHKVYVQSVLWNINPFDQWGVELGKQLSMPIFHELNGAPTINGNMQDASTTALIVRYQQLSKPGKA